MKRKKEINKPGRQGKNTTRKTGHRTEEKPAPSMGTPLYGDRGIEIQVVWGGKKKKQVKFSSKAVFELYINYTSIRNKLGASLVAQWLRICLPMQGTRVRALVWEDPTCRGATRPVSHNY